MTPAEKVVIRRAHVADIASIAALMEAAPEAAQWSRPALADYCSGENQSAQNKVLFLACCWVDVDEGESAAEPRAAMAEPVGFAAFSSIAGTGECWLENMAVALQWRRRGMGSRLLAAGELWCRAYAGSNLWLEVRASNHVAIALYSRAGFAVAGRRTGYYSRPDEDALEMQCVLKPSSGIH